MNDITYNLKPIYDHHKSFYGKARVRQSSGMVSLISYNTRVAIIENGVVTVYGLYSITTLRHIKEFLKQYGYEASNKSQIIKDYAPTNGA